MYALSCKDMDVADCDFVAMGDTVRKVQDVMFAHARDEHPELIAGISWEGRRELEQMMEERVTLRSAA